MNKRIALFFDRPYIDAHFCFTELALNLVKSGYLVDLYYNQNPYNPPPVFFDDRIRLFNFPSGKLRLLNLKRKLLSRTIQYSAVFGTPIDGSWLAYNVSKMLNVPMFYLADEIFDPNIRTFDIENVGEMKKKDIISNRHATATIALSQERFEYQRNVNNLSLKDSSVFIMPNSASGLSTQLKSNYFRDILEIDNQKPILLFIGTITWSLAKKLYEFSRDFQSKPYNLVFHGRTKGLIGNNSDHNFIHISQNPLPSNLLNYAISSADIGLVLYDKDVESDCKNSMTGGKIGTYLKNNLPIIYGNDPNLKALDSDKIGIFIDELNDIDTAFDEIFLNIEEYKLNVKEYYSNNLDYGQFYKPFEVMLTELIGN